MAMGVIDSLGTSSGLARLLLAEDIQPGDDPSYQTCKLLMAYHPLGAKMTDTPLELAQSQRRKITVQDGPEDDLVEAFEREWLALGADAHIFNTGRLARGYGICTVGLLVKGKKAGESIDLKDIWDQTIAFNVWDPLNTAGSLTLNQDPNSLDFLKVDGVAVNGERYHRSRTVTLQNEHPLYIEWTSSAYGFTGRSVFQRTLYPLKSYIRSMITDEMIELKVGVLVLKRMSPSSIISQAMENVAAFVRGLIQQAETGNVLTIDPAESIESLNFQNVDAPHALARKNILDNIATGAGMPAIILNQETFAEGFGEGTEDARRVAQFVNRVREWLAGLYAWFDDIAMHRAWNPKFYEEQIQAKYPEQYAGVSYEAAFYRWKNSFKAFWPNFLEEPESEKIRVEDVKFKAAVAAFEVMFPALAADAQARATLIQWLCDVFNDRKELFPSPLNLDIDALLEAMEKLAESQQAMMSGAGGNDEALEAPKPAPPFSPRDSVTGLPAPGLDAKKVRVTEALAALTRSVKELPDLRAQAQEDRAARLSKAPA